jgi:hypothetical protein
MRDSIFKLISQSAFNVEAVGKTGRTQDQQTKLAQINSRFALLSYLKQRLIPRLMLGLLL